MDNTLMEGQTNNKEPTLADIKASSCNITYSIKGIEQRLGKLEIISNKVDELETKKNILKKWFKKVELAQNFMCDKSDEKEKQIAKITQENKDLPKENNLLNKMIKQMDDDLEIEKTKQNALEQYGRQEMLEVTSIPPQRWWKLHWHYLQTMWININKYKKI